MPRRRRRWWQRVKRIEAVCDAHNVPLAAAALQFPLAHPAVCAIIPGPRSAAEFEANLGLLQMKIPAALWARSAHGRAAASRGTDARLILTSPAFGGITSPAGAGEVDGAKHRG